MPVSIGKQRTLNGKVLDLAYAVVPTDNFGYAIIESLADGRFSLDEANNRIFDREEAKFYTLPADADPDTAAFQNITALTGANPMRLKFLKHLIRKPMLNVPDATIQDPTLCPKLALSADGAKSIWEFPDGGIDSDVSGFKLVPGATMTTVSDAGVVHKVNDDGTTEELVAFPGSQDVEIVTDTGHTLRVEIARLVVLASGKYELRDMSYSNSLIFKDGDPTNLAVANLALQVDEVDTNYVEGDPATDRIREANEV